MGEKLVLIVEDEALVAMEMEDRVRDLGYDVLGPAATVARAHELLDQRTPDAALLDVNLRGEMATPVARRLTEAGIPFGLVTGYARLTLGDPHLFAAPRLAKPVSESGLAKLLQILLEPHAPE